MHKHSITFREGYDIFDRIIHIYSMMSGLSFDECLERYTLTAAQMIQEDYNVLPPTEEDFNAFANAVIGLTEKG